MDKQELIYELNKLSADDLEEVLSKTDLLIHYGVNHHSSPTSFGCAPIYAAVVGANSTVNHIDETEIYLLNTGPNKIKVWQEIRKHIDLPILEMKKFTDNLPKLLCTFETYFDENRIKQVKDAFEKLGAEIYLKKI